MEELPWGDLGHEGAFGPPNERSAECPWTKCRMDAWSDRTECLRSECEEGPGLKSFDTGDGQLRYMACPGSHSGQQKHQEF